ncbi:MAG: hypothetical protein KJ737_23375 [Proteobacteria bacterium]|nr:hypothetical protein [Pseudomonadota bacterium]
MDKIWNDMLYPDGQVSYPDSEQWKIWRQKITTDVGGLAAGFRSEILLRGYKVIEEMTGNISFIQAWALSITGRLPDKYEDRLLNALFVNTAIADPRFWFNRTARLAATVKSSPAGCIAAGIATKDGEFFSSGPAYNTARFFKETLIKIKSGERTLEDIVIEKIKNKEIITGFGRVLARGKDERNASLLKIAQKYNLDKGAYLDLAFKVEKLLQQHKSEDLFMNGGGLRSALLLDMKFKPHQIMIFNMIMHIIGLAGNVTEAFEQQPGQFLPLTDEDIKYTGLPKRRLPSPSEKQSIVRQKNGKRVIVMDSVSYIEMANRGDIIVTGSHGGMPAAEHGIRFKPRCLVFNDAGTGKENAGVKGLESLDEAGIASAAVSYTSARIGDGMDTYHHGVLSTVNNTMKAMGIYEGMTVKDATEIIIGLEKTDEYC